jgi:hypothetical protein
MIEERLVWHFIEPCKTRWTQKQFYNLFDDDKISKITLWGEIEIQIEKESRMKVGYQIEKWVSFRIKNSFICSKMSFYSSPGA